jgi:FkbM family methyltransferase
LILRHSRLTYAQFGEDILLGHIFHDKPEGFFVDIGAYHPVRFSNTFALYLQGWRGINVDGNHDAIEIFKSVRPEDINIHALVSDQVETKEFYRFKEGAWNSTNQEAVEILRARGQDQGTLIGTDRMETVPIMRILEQHVGNKKFDLLTVDVEGLDIQIIRSIDFSRYRPKVIAAEIGIMEWIEEPFQAFIRDIGYEFYAQCMHTLILRRKN